MCHGVVDDEFKVFAIFDIDVDWTSISYWCLCIYVWICSLMLLWIQTLNRILVSMWIALAFFMLVGVVVLLHRIWERLCHIQCHLGIIIQYYTLTSWWWLNGEDDLPQTWWRSCSESPHKVMIEYVSLLFVWFEFIQLLFSKNGC